MGADDIAQAARRRNAVARRSLAVRRAQQRRFRIGLACAVAAHALLFVGVGTWSSARYMGEPDASPDGISVELVDAADLMSKTTVPPSAPAALHHHRHPRRHHRRPRSSLRRQSSRSPHPRLRRRTPTQSRRPPSSRHSRIRPRSRPQRPRQRRRGRPATPGPPGAEPARRITCTSGSIGGIRAATRNHALRGE